MNFNLSLLKLISSIIGGLILTFINVQIFPSSFVCFEIPCEAMLKEVYLPVILTFLGSMILIYLIWSLIQKK